jgi:hypothetical protein
MDCDYYVQHNIVINYFINIKNNYIFIKIVYYKMDFKSAVNVKQQKKQINISKWDDILKDNSSKWIQYKFKDGKIKCLNDKKELTEEEQQQEIIDTLDQISYAIELNRYKYMIKYDELHGDGAYDRLYYMEPIYNNLELELSLDSEEEVNSDYEQNIYCD